MLGIQAPTVFRAWFSGEDCGVMVNLKVHPQSPLGALDKGGLPHADCSVSHCPAGTPQVLGPSQRPSTP